MIAVDCTHQLFSCAFLMKSQDPELVRLDADTKISPDLALAFFTVR